jgi:hypothetical protein
VRNKVRDEESFEEKRKECSYRITAVNRFMNRAVRRYTDIYRYVCIHGTCDVKERDVNTGMDLWQQQCSI